MQKVGRFEIVSEKNYAQIVEQMNQSLERENLIPQEYTPYDKLQLPVRKTIDSAGYDFFLTRDVNLYTGQSVVIPTFVRCFIESGWMLKLYPRSSFGFKYNMKLANTIGIVDADYYWSVTDGPDNEGHIMVKIVNEGNEIMHLKAGDRFCQGIFEMYGITFTDADDAHEVRQGGVGSTGTN